MRGGCGFDMSGPRTSTQDCEALQPSAATLSEVNLNSEHKQKRHHPYSCWCKTDQNSDKRVSVGAYTTDKSVSSIPAQPCFRLFIQLIRDIPLGCSRIRWLHPPPQAAELGASLPESGSLSCWAVPCLSFAIWEMWLIKSSTSQNCREDEKRLALEQCRVSVQYTEKISSEATGSWFLLTSQWLTSCFLFFSSVSSTSLLQSFHLLFGFSVISFYYYPQRPSQTSWSDHFVQHPSFFHNVLQFLVEFKGRTESCQQGKCCHWMPSIQNAGVIKVRLSRSQVPASPLSGQDILGQSLNHPQHCPL